MLEEINTERSSRERRRWFRDEVFDLFVWLDEKSQVIRLELGSSHRGRQQLLAWDPNCGVQHYLVEDDHRPGSHPVSPLLTDAGEFDANWYRNEFESRARQVDDDIIKVVVNAIEGLEHKPTPSNSALQSTESIESRQGMILWLIATVAFAATLIILWR